MSEKEKTQAKLFNGYLVYDDGRVMRPNLTEVQGTRIGKKGHVLMTLGGQTVYLARLVYCIFNGLNYDEFKDRIRYYGSYEDCSLKNIFVVSKPERMVSNPRRVVDPWKVRTLFCSGLAPAEISNMVNLPASRIKTICLGFESCELDEITRIKAIVQAAKR